MLFIFHLIIPYMVLENIKKMIKVESPMLEC